MTSKLRIIAGALFLIKGICMDLTAFGQNKSDVDDDLLSKKEKTEKDYTSKVIQQGELIKATNNNARLEQVGNGNNSSINQFHSGGINPNLVTVIQNGNGNESSVDQIGSGNKTLVDQDGNNNRYDGNIYGNNITNGIRQSGNRNQIEQELTGDNLNFNLIQDGNNNQLFHLDNGTGNTAPQIIQDGHNMNLRIEVR